MNTNISLCLGESFTGSKLNKLVYEEELKEINLKYPLDSNQVDIKSTYFLKNINKLEVGFFIRNGLTKNISFENIALVVEDNHGNIISTDNFNFKNDGVIPPQSARPFVVQFPINHEIDMSNIENYIVKFSGVNKINTFHSVTTELEDLSIEIDFEEEKKIKDFIKGLKTLEDGEFDIATFRLKYRNDGALECIVFFRNGSLKEAKVETLPISIISQENRLIARKMFANKEGLLKLGPRQSKFMTFEFLSTEISSQKVDLSKCVVIYKYI